MKVSTKERLESMNIVMASTDETVKPLLNSRGIEELKELSVPICGVVNTIVNKKSWASLIGLLPGLPAAISGVEDVSEEILNMTEEEFVEFTDFLKEQLNFDDEKIEVVVEDIAIHTLGLFLAIMKLV